MKCYVAVSFGLNHPFLEEGRRLQKAQEDHKIYRTHWGLPAVRQAASALQLSSWWNELFSDLTI